MSRISISHRLLDRESPLDFFRLDCEPVEMVLDSLLGTSGGGGFLLIDEYAEELCWLYGATFTFGLM